MRETEIRKKVVKILTDARWTYWYPPKVKYKQNDIFGTFDIICCEKVTGNLKFIQVTTLSNLSTRRKKIQNFFRKNKINSEIILNFGVEIWAWNKRNKTFKIELI